MNRKPKTASEMPSEDNTDTSDVTDWPPGRRFVSAEVAAIEVDLLQDGVDLPNRGIPARYRSQVADCSDADELRALIETETNKDYPNRQLIAFINNRLLEVDGDE